MKNQLKTYLGEDYYDGSHIQNFLNYWIKGISGMPDYENDRENYEAWRKVNDLDCLYFDGNLNADTLMSAWAPINWVVTFLSTDPGKRFFKYARDHEDPCFYLKQLVSEQNKYLPRDNSLVQLLEEFTKLAELRCNFILLPDEKMNADRYSIMIDGEKTWLCDQVPTTLFHVFEKNSLGKYFLNEYGEVDQDKVREWIIREHLEHAFNGDIEQKNVIPLMAGANPAIAKWPETKNEIEDALNYMISFLKERQTKFDV